MANNALHVTTGKPKIGGSLYRAPLGTALPTDATTPLDEAFQCLGYCSDEGLVNSTETENETIKAWGGDTVLEVLTGKQDHWQFTLIEALSVAVLKTVYGDDNVSGDLESGITVKANTAALPYSVYVAEMILNGNVLKRVVLPQAKVIEVGDITYADGEAVGYETTLSAVPDAAGNTHYEYMKKAAA